MALPENVVGEILDGELFASPRPAVAHALAASRIYGALIPAEGDAPTSGGSTAGWWILFEPELHLGPDVLVPDLAGWRRTRVPTLPDVAAMTIAPDWACEVISPSTGAIDRGRKMRIYAREGVAHLWFVDPTPRTLEVYRLEAGRWIVLATHAGPEMANVEPFADFALDMRRWWRDAGT